jgi:hypothetical protein
MNPLRLAIIIQHTPERDDSEVYQALRQVVMVYKPPWCQGAVVTHAAGPAAPGDWTWMSYRLCLDGGLLLESAPTHLLVLQDDVSLAPGIWEHLTAIISARRDQVVSLFCGAWPHMSAFAMQQAAVGGRHWARLDLAEFVPAQALIWPRAVAERLLADTESVEGPDDQHIARWAHAAGETLWQTVPSLVEHEGAFETSVPPKLTGGHRRAVCHVRDLGWPGSWEG